VDELKKALQLSSVGLEFSYAQWWLAPGAKDWICEELRQVLEFAQLTRVRLEWM